MTTIFLNYLYLTFPPIFANQCRGPGLLSYVIKDYFSSFTGRTRNTFLFPEGVDLYARTQIHKAQINTHQLQWCLPSSQDLVGRIMGGRGGGYSQRGESKIRVSQHSKHTGPETVREGVRWLQLSDSQKHQGLSLLTVVRRVGVSRHKVTGRIGSVFCCSGYRLRDGHQVGLYGPAECMHTDLHGWGQEFIQ